MTLKRTNLVQLIKLFLTTACKLQCGLELTVLLIRHLSGIFLNSLGKPILTIFSLGGTWSRGRPGFVEVLMSSVSRGGRIWP